ncbi:MAG: ABC transporter ATP-binding protein [Nitrososphaerota archaeon]
MEEFEMTPQQSSLRFARNATLIILVTFTLIEVTSLLLPWRGSTSNLAYWVNISASSLIVLFCLLGSYGLITNNPLWIFFAFLAPLWEVVWNSSLLVTGSQVGRPLLLTVQESGFILMGGVALFFAFRFLQFAQKHHRCSPSDLESSRCQQDSSYAVEVNDVFKKYFVGPVVVPALNGLTLKVKKGEFVAIMGPSGCGKSTLLNLIGALDKPTSGKILIDQVDISTLDQKDLANLRNQKIGFIFQSFNLVNRSTVFRNVELPILVKGLSRNEREHRVKEVLEVVALFDKAYRKPKELSGGEQQRVAIARAFVNKPSIILADEPTGNLDSKTGKAIIDFMKKLNKETGTTIIIVTHDPYIAKATDRIVYLRDGKIINEEVTTESLTEA